MATIAVGSPKSSMQEAFQQQACLIVSYKTINRFRGEVSCVDSTINLGSHRASWFAYFQVTFGM
jgi:hypothetical protein